MFVKLNKPPLQFLESRIVYKIMTYTPQIRTDDTKLSTIKNIRNILRVYDYNIIYCAFYTSI